MIYGCGRKSNGFVAKSIEQDREREASAAMTALKEAESKHKRTMAEYQRLLNSGMDPSEAEVYAKINVLLNRDK